ncbi:choice-of-anchor D domain-containing protein [Cystobacter fuscus]
MLGRRGSCLATCLFAVLVAGCERPSSQRASSHLGLTPGKLEFGLSAVGITRTKTVRLSNQGRAPLRVRGVSATLPDVRVEPFEPFELPSGGEREVEVRFTPEGEGTVEGRLEVLTDADNVGREGVAVLGVGGQGVKASLEVLVRTLDFGDVETGHLEVRELVVRNASLVDSPVRLSLSGLDADAFGSDAVGAPFSLQPGAQRRLSLSFLPERLGAAEAEAHVGVECFGCEPSVVKLSGTGIASRLEVTPLRVDFGRVAVGSTAEERVTVRNLGSEPLAYGGVRLLEGSGGTSTGERAHASRRGAGPGRPGGGARVLLAHHPRGGALGAPGGGRAAPGLHPPGTQGVNRGRGRLGVRGAPASPARLRRGARGHERHPRRAGHQPLPRGRAGGRAEDLPGQGWLFPARPGAREPARSRGPVPRAAHYLHAARGGGGG